MPENGPDSDRDGLSALTQDELDYELMKSAMDGDAARVATLLERGANAKKADAHAFLLAARAGRDEVVKLLLEHGVTPVDTHGQALTEAATNGHVETVALLIDAGAEIGVDNNNPLGWACGNGHTETAKLLIEHGADPTRMVPLAAGNGHAETVQMLLEHGADPKQKGKDDLAPDLLAGMSGDRKLVDVFRRWARRAEKLDMPSSEFEGKSLAELRRMQDFKGNDGFMQAAKSGNFGVVATTLREKGADTITLADLSRKNADGHTVVDILGARGELDKLYDGRLWHNRSSELVKLGKTLVAPVYRAQINLQKTLNDISRMTLKRRVGRKAGLRPGGKPPRR